jgi:glycogen(starch) synthase
MRDTGGHSVVILACKNLSHNTRVVRQARALHDAGYRVVIVSNQEEGTPPREITDHYEHIRIRPHVATGRWITALPVKAIRKKNVRLGNELAYIHNALGALKGRKADIYHAHDSYPLVIAYILAKLKRSKLVYDSVELAFDTSRPASASKGRLRLWLERFIVRRADAILATSQGHAEKIAAYYEVDKTCVVMNCMEFRPLSALESPDPARGKVVVYSGSVTRSYGLYSLAKATTYLEGVTTLIMGPENTRGYKRELGVLIRWLEAEDRVLLLDPVGTEEVIAHLASANVGVIPPPRDIPNYRYALPNKFFDYIMARLPVVTYATPDMRRLVEWHDIGIVLADESPEALADAIRSVLANEEYYRANLEKIAPWYSWEMESAKMIDVYNRLVA